MIYVVAIDPAAPGEAEHKVADWLMRQMEGVAEPMPRLWIAHGALAAEQIFNALAPLLGGNARLIVVKAATEAIWQGLDGENATWLAENFPGSITERIPDPAEGRARG